MHPSLHYDGSTATRAGTIASLTAAEVHYVPYSENKFLAIFKILMGSSHGLRVMSYSRTIAACHQVPLSRTDRFLHALERRPRDEAARELLSIYRHSPGGLSEVPVYTKTALATDQQLVSNIV